MNDLQCLVPEGTTHFTIEERMHRGSTVYAVVAIVPDGASVPLNGYSTRELAESTVAMLTPVGRANPTTPPATCHLPRWINADGVCEHTDHTDNQDAMDAAIAAEEERIATYPDRLEGAL
jgi:hypothetical protein